MLDQIVRWAEITGTAVDALFVFRLLWLRLNRTYLFVTLYAVVSIIFDVAGWWLGHRSEEYKWLVAYSMFVEAAMFPLAAWDCFEGTPAPLQAFRRPQLLRLVSGMLLTTVLALLIGGTSGENTSTLDITTEIGFVLWLSASAASLGFVWMMRRLARVQGVTFGGNSATLSTFFLVTFSLELVSGMTILLPTNAKIAGAVSEIALTAVGVAVTIWCVARLRRDSGAYASTGDDLVRR